MRVSPIDTKAQTVETPSVRYVLLGNSGFGAVEWRKSSGSERRSTRTAPVAGWAIVSGSTLLWCSDS